MKQKLLEMIQVTVLFHTDEFILVFGPSKTERAPKPLIGCQNWVTSTGGRHNLLHGLTMEHRPYTLLGNL